MWGILSWVLLGLVAGILAKFLMPGKGVPGGIIFTILLGIAGALVGGFLASLIGWGGAAGFDVRSIIVAVAGACVLLFAYQFLRKR